MPQVIAEPDHVATHLAAPLPWPAAAPWHLLHSRPRQEKALAGVLQAMGVACFLPLVRHVHLAGRRRLTAELPLFPGYVFLKGSLDDCYRADRTRRVAQVIRVTDQATLDWELRNLYLALTREAPLDPHPYLRVGQRVEVGAGPLRGLQGVVEERLPRAGLSRVVLRVQTLGRAVSVEVDAATLEPI